MRIADRSVLQPDSHVAGNARRRTRRSRPHEDHSAHAGNAARRSDFALLANIYLHWFEKAFHGPDGPATWAKAKIVRYADDFVILARYQRRPAERLDGIAARRPLPADDQSEKTRVVKLEPAGRRVSTSWGSRFGTTATC